VNVHAEIVLRERGRRVVRAIEERVGPLHEIAEVLWWVGEEHPGILRQHLEPAGWAVGDALEEAVEQLDAAVRVWTSLLVEARRLFAGANGREPLEWRPCWYWWLIVSRPGDSRGLARVLHDAVGGLPAEPDGVIRPWGRTS